MYYYKCSGRKQKNGCNKQVVRKDTLEKIILDKLIECLSEPDIVKKIVKELMKRQEKGIEENSLLKTLIKEEKQAQNALANIVAAIESGIYNKTTQKRMQELEAQIEALQGQIILENNKTVIKVSEKGIRDYYKQVLTGKPEMLMELFVKRIDLFDDKAIIKLNAPISESPDESQGLLLYEKTQLLSLSKQRKISVKILI